MAVPASMSMIRTGGRTDRTKISFHDHWSVSSSNQITRFTSTSIDCCDTRVDLRLFDFFTSRHSFDSHSHPSTSITWEMQRLSSSFYSNSSRYLRLAQLVPRSSLSTEQKETRVPNDLRGSQSTDTVDTSAKITPTLTGTSKVWWVRIDLRVSPSLFSSGRCKTRGPCTWLLWRKQQRRNSIQSIIRQQFTRPKAKWISPIRSKRNVFNLKWRLVNWPKPQPRLPFNRLPPTPRAALLWPTTRSSLRKSPRPTFIRARPRPPLISKVSFQTSRRRTSPTKLVNKAKSSVAKTHRHRTRNIRKKIRLATRRKPKKSPFNAKATFGRIFFVKRCSTLTNAAGRWTPFVQASGRRINRPPSKDCSAMVTI